jgi:putative transposase
MSNETTVAPVDGGEETEAPAAGLAFEGDGLRGWAEALVDRARSEGLALTGEGGLLTSMVREVLQTGLDVEMADHLGYEPYEAIGRGSGNSRNGAYAKTVRTDVGPVELRMPRDREGTFDPVTVPKHVRRLEGLGANVISLYAKGLTTGEIQAHLAEIYDTEVSRETISKITDQVLPDMAAWQSRPLDRVYPVLLIDAIVVKVRDSQVANRPVYVAIGVDLDGERDVLGLWLGPSGGEGAKQWMSMLSELRNRGLHDALIVCCDGLKGLPEAIRVTWPNATVQTCVVHLVLALRLQEVLGQDRHESARDLHSADRRGRRSPLPGLRGGVEAALPSNDPLVGERMGGVRAIPRVPRRAPKDRLHDKRDRVPER